MATAAAIIAATATGVSAVIQARGAQVQAQAQVQAATFNSKVAQQNAQASRQQAQVEANQIDRQNRIRLGRLKAVTAGAGIEFQGSVISLIGDTVAQGELDRQNALWRGEMRARGFNIESTLARQEARDARRAGRFRVAGALLGGASQVGQQVATFSPSFDSPGGGGSAGPAPAGGGRFSGIGG